MARFKTTCNGTIIVPYKAEAHLKTHPSVRKVLTEAIAMLRLPTDKSFLAIEVAMGRVVGLAECVKAPVIKVNQETFFAQRKERQGVSRITQESKGEESSKLAIFAFASREDARVYVLATAFIGSINHKEPWDRNIKSQEEYQKSINFWSSHALVYDPKVMEKVFKSTWEKALLL